MSVVLVAPNSELASQVIALSKASQGTLGQLPYSAFHQAAANGTLIAALTGGEVVGYVLYRIRKRTGIVMLTQLCVRAEARGSGVAQLLVDGVRERNPQCPGIGLWCREDYDASKAWPGLGFGSTGNRPGRGRDGQRLVHWWCSVAELTLFTFDPAAEDLPAVALDANVFRDIHEPRTEFRSSRALMDDWLVDVVEFVVTSQLETEIEESSRTVPALLGRTSQYRRLAPSSEAWKGEYDRLRPHLSVPDIKAKDQRHIAQAAAGGAHYFVTRDRGILSHAATIEELCELSVVSPDDLLLQLHADLFGASYRAESILETPASVLPLTAVPTRQRLTPFVELHRNERASEVQKLFKTAAAEVADGWRQWAVVDADNQWLAVAAFEVSPDELSACVVRVRRGIDRRTFARQLVHLLRQEAARSGCKRIVVTDEVGEYMVDSLIEEGLSPMSGGWVASCVPGLFELDSEHAREAIPTQGRLPHMLFQSVSDAERRCWPAKFIGAGVPTYVVPIQARWARALFDADPPQAEFFGRPMGLGLAREHVYYRTYRSTLQFPARLIWYVSGEGSNRGFRAVSWLDSVVSDRPGSLFQRYGSRGIYAADDVQSLVKTKGGRATAMLFSRTEVFPNSISLRRARQLCPDMIANGFLQTTRPVDEHVFYDFYREAFQ